MVDNGAPPPEVDDLSGVAMDRLRIRGMDCDSDKIGQLQLTWCRPVSCGWVCFVTPIPQNDAHPSGQRYGQRKGCFTRLKQFECW